MTIIDVRGRRSGMTYDFIIAASVSKSIILVKDSKRMEYIEEMAERMERHVFVLTYDEYVMRHLEYDKYDIYIDDGNNFIEHCVNKMFFGQKVVIGVSTEKIKPHIHGLKEAQDE